MARIGVFHAEVGPMTFEVGPRPVVVGRPGGGAQFEMTWDTLVSRAHGQFWVQGNELFYADLGSKNGSWIGGQRIGNGGIRLPVGSSITLGTTIFTVLDFDANLTPAAPAMSPFAQPPVAVPAVSAPGFGATSGVPLPGGQFAKPSGTTAFQRPGFELRSVTEQRPVDPRLASFGAQGQTAAQARPAFGTNAFQAPPALAQAAQTQNPTDRRKGQWADGGANTELFPIPLDPGAISRLAADTFADKAPEPAPDIIDSEVQRALESVSPAPEPKPRTSSHSAGDPSPPVPAKRAETTAPKHTVAFQGPERVEVVVRDRAAFTAIYTTEISKGGLFVPSPSPPSVGRRVEVAITTPDGQIVTRGEIVHVLTGELAKRMGQAEGAGIQLTEAWAKEALRRYSDGSEASLSGNRPAQAAKVAANQEVLQLAKDILTRCEENKLYEALGVVFTAKPEEIKKAVAHLTTKLSSPLGDVTPAQAARIETAKKLLNRLQTMLTDPVRRAEHDFKSGLLRIQERIRMAATGDGPGERELREAWLRAFPDRGERSRQATKRAIQAAQRAKFDEAVRAAKEALDADPFHEELRKSLASWELMLTKSR